MSTSRLADQAHDVATRNREAAAAQLLDVACKEAAGIVRVGLEHGDKWAGYDARRVLARAQLRASRILGPGEGLAS